jgi:hypothetical protein
MMACTKRFLVASANKMDSLSIAGVIPVMDGIHRHLSSVLDASAGKPMHIRWGAIRARDLLDKYYSKTDESSLYRVAIRKYSRFLTLTLNAFKRSNVIFFYR